jgi:uncharacterized OB-fold protein
MSEQPQLPTRAPRRDHETAEFWDACAEGRLVVPRCDDCGDLFWYPRLVCPICGSMSVTYTAVSGRGNVYARTIMRRGDGPFRGAAPYVLAMVQLEEGPIMMTNVVGADPDTVAIGQAVRVVFDPVPDGTDAVPRFTPVA